MDYEQSSIQDFESFLRKTRTAKDGINFNWNYISDTDNYKIPPGTF